MFSHYGFEDHDLTPGLVGPESDQQITIQGLITINAAVHPGLLQQRAPLGRSKGTKVIGEGHIDNNRIKVEPGEMFFIEKNLQFMDAGKTAFRVTGFTSFNGIEIREKSQQSFDDRFACLGFATSPFYGEGDPVSRSGVAVQKAGSGTTVNNSLVTFCPGDVFGWELPSIDEKIRQGQYESVDYRRRGNFSVQKKYIGLVKRITYQDVVGSFDHIANLTVRNNSLLKIPERRLNALTGRPSTLGDTHQMCLALKEYNMTAAYSGVMAAIERGLVVPTVDSLADPRESAALQRWYNTFAPLRSSSRGLSTTGGGQIKTHKWIGGISPDLFQTILAAILADPVMVNIIAAAQLAVQAIAEGSIATGESRNVRSAAGEVFFTNAAGGLAAARGKILPAAAPVEVLRREVVASDAANAADYGRNLHATAAPIPLLTDGAGGGPGSVPASGAGGAGAVNAATISAGVERYIQGQIRTILQNRIAVGDGRFEPVASTDISEIARRKTAHHGFSEVMSTFFGLTEDPAGVRVLPSSIRVGIEDTELTQSANTRILLSSLSEASDEKYDAYERYVGNEFEEYQQMEPTDIFGTRMTHAPRVPGQMLSIYRSTARNFSRLHGRMFDRTFSSALGTVSNYCPPNASLIYALS